MRRSIILAAFTALLICAFRVGSQEAPSARVRELAPGVFYWQGDLATHRQTNCAWVVFRDWVLVIDANFPWGAREILADLKKTTNKPVKFVWDTHYHADHAYGNSVFVDAGAAVVCSEDCGWESRLKGQRDVENQVKEVHSEPLEHPSLMFETRLVFDDGNKRVELTKVGPAHTKGDGIAYLPREKILFVGDLAVNWPDGNNLSDVDADHANWVRVLDRLLKVDVRIVVPAHGGLGNMATLQGQRDYLGEMLQSVEEGIRGGKTADQVSQEINLTKYQPFGAEPRRTQGQVRTMYRALMAKSRK
jgi:glyoxylase-like metal-dependent hydrolase (beta-lactamase superfamily II)